MSTLAVNGIQAVARGGVQALSRVAVQTATSYALNALDNRTFEGPQLESFHLQTSRDGASLPRVFGRVRLAGQVIWASRVREIVTEESVGGKGGGPTRRDYSYTISFAVALCEGEILGVDRLWANGEILARSGLTIRVHTGSDTQGPDPVIAATEPGDVPAFRGTAYIVFEDFPLSDYGNRLPIINAEVVRASSQSGRMEQLIRSVNLLPGTGEFALSPTIVEEVPGIGVTVPANMNSFTGQADLITALDQMQAELPNVEHVNLIVSWFGSSTDCAQCLIRPGAERVDRQIDGADWAVAGQTRDTSYIVSADGEGRPNFGGTPSDQSVIDCIRELKQRGLAVTLYPFLLMDTPGFPWRGRIISVNDQTNAVTADVDVFFGTDEDFRFRHHILHHARLAVEAGGVDAIVIGSELVSLCALRDAGDSFPTVAKLQALATDVRAIVGPSTKITYAADWSDYSGLQDGLDWFCHLDPLWADDNIDAVGIDAYFPLSDWRDGDDHLDAAPGRRAQDVDYLTENVEGGEGYDWFYASQADRDAQIRTPITDGAHNKPWVYRYKDLRNWWANSHHERRGGVETAQSPWMAGSKPIWLLEYGCPAVNKGANQPNLFSDGKSVDSGIPYYSDGLRDDLIQRRYIEAFLGHYGATNEPGFLDLSRASVWAWDARPYPDYPARTVVWSDGANWARGHWLNGRTGLMPVADIISEIAVASGLTEIDVSGVSGVIPGYVVDRPMSARAALSPLLSLFAIELNERAGQVSFTVGGPTVTTLNPDEMVAQKGGPLRVVQADPERRIRDVRVSYLDASRDYQLGTASARNLNAESVAVSDIRVPAVLDEGFARYVAKRELDIAHAGEARATGALPLTAGLALEPGDRVEVLGDVWAVETVEIGPQVDLTLRRDVRANADWVSGAMPSDPGELIYPGAAQLFAFDLPGRSGVSVGAMISPFETVTAIGPDSAEVTLDAPLRLGVTLSDLSSASPLVWDDGPALDIQISGLAASSVEDSFILDGANRFAVETSLGWEVFAAGEAELIGANTYRLRHRLRGLEGSDAFMDAVVPSGARIVWVGRGLETLPLSSDWRGETITVNGATASRDARPGETLWSDLAGEPLSPVHARWDGETLSWIGRDLAFTGWEEDASHLRYRVRLTRGSDVETIDTADRSVVTSAFDEAEIVQVASDGRESLPFQLVPSP